MYIKNISSELDWIFDKISHTNVVHLSDSVDVKHFHKNNIDPANSLLAYIEYGGVLGFYSKCMFSISNINLYILIFINSGKCKIRCSAEEKTFSSGSFLLLKPNEHYHISVCSNNLTGNAYLMSGEILDYYWKEFEHTHNTTCIFHQLHNNWDLINNTTVRINHLLFSPEPTAFYLEASYIQSILATMLSLVTEAPSSNSVLPKHVSLSKEMLDMYYYESITLDDLAMAVGKNKYQICRDFTNYLGISPLKYLNSIRINKAKNLLITTSDTVHSIGLTIGIQNTTHFINLFKKETGLTPLQYRDMHC